MKFICQKFLALVGLSTLAVGALQAQDARYSQYYTAPLRVNPALIGVFDGNYRIGLNYRTQWGAILGEAYNTYAVTADARFALPSKDYIGVGFSAATDKAGLPGYNATDVNVGFSYMKRLSGGGRRRFTRDRSVGSFLVAGGQVGLVQRGVNWSNFTFSTQYDVSDNTYNSSTYSGESANVRQNKISADINAGLAWYGVFGRRKSAYAGLGLYHINRPDISIFNEPARDSSGRVVGGTSVERLYTRFTVHAGGEVLLGQSPLSLVPGAVLMFQGPSTEANLGLSLRYQESKYDDFAFKFGIWTRVVKHLESGVRPDALIAMVGLDYNQMHFGISYDATISSLGQQVNGRGSLEFSAMYIINTDSKQRQTCPAFN